MLVIHNDLGNVLDQRDEELDVRQEVETGEPGDGAHDGEADGDYDDDCHDD